MTGRTIIALAVFLTLVASAGGAEDRKAIFAELSRIAIEKMWGNAVGLDGKPLQPKNDKERTTIPITPEHAEYVILSAAVVGQAMWCGLDWNADYLRYMQIERKRHSPTTTQVAYIGFLFGLSQQQFAKAFAMGGKCTDQDRSKVQHDLKALGR